MCMSDERPTCYDLSPVKDDLSITDVEIAALNCVDLVEYASEPLNRFTLCRALVSLIAKAARLTCR